jgi:hypothetical protein
MKLTSLFSVTIFSALSVYAIGSQAAETLEKYPKIERWVGTGAEYTPLGQELSTYEIVVLNTIAGDGRVHSEAKITTALGANRVITQDLTIKGNRWSNISNLGKGGGACYGPEMCENYLEDDSGKGYATTIVIDGRSQRRNLTIVLQNGKAIKVVREKISRAQ